MEVIKELPIDFFEKTRPNAPETLKEIIPFKWSNEKEILSGKRTKEVIVTLPSK